MITEPRQLQCTFQSVLVETVQVWRGRIGLTCLLAERQGTSLLYVVNVQAFEKAQNEPLGEQSGGLLSQVDFLDHEAHLFDSMYL